MNKVKFLTILVIGLILINVTLFGFILFRKPPHPKHEGPRTEIIEKLSLDDAQIVEYDKLIEWHQNEIVKSEDEILIVKNALYENLNNPNATAIKDSLIHELSKIQIKIESIHYKHFEDLRAICKDDQLDKFSALTKELATLFKPLSIKGPKK